MKILALAQTADASNGWGRYSSHLVGAMRELGQDVTLLVEQGHSTPFLQAEPILKHSDAQPSCEAPSGKRPPSSHEPARWVPIHALDETKLPLAVALAALSGRPFAATLHGSHAVRMLERRGTRYRFLMRHARRLILPSDYTRRRVLTLAPALEDRMTTTPLGVDSPSSEVRSFGQRQPFALSLGAIKPRKGVLQALQAVIALRFRLPEFRLVVAGAYEPSDSYVKQLLSTADAAGASDALELKGKVEHEEVADLLSSARVLLMPSQDVKEGFEGFGLVHLEAASHGLPAIGSLESGNEDAIRDGVTGYLVPQGNAEALSERLFSLATDEETWTAMSRASVAFAHERSWTHTAWRTLDAYFTSPE